VDRLRGMRRLRRLVGIGAPDRSLTAVSGMVAVTALVDRLSMVRLLDAAIGPIKARDRGCSGGQLLVGLAAAHLAGEDFLVGLDRQRDDVAGQVLAPVPGLSSTTAAGLARRFTEGQWRAVETGIGDVQTAVLAALSPQRVAALCETVTIDLDTTDVEVYGRKKRGVAYNYLGQRCGRPHVATWAETCTALAADLMAGDEDPRGHAAGLLGRALAALPAVARAGRVLLRADAGYFAGQLARAALAAGVEFAIGAKRIAPLWRILDGVAEGDWVEAIDMDGAQVAVADYCPDWWPSATRLLIRRVRLSPDQVSADPRSRRRRTLHPDQRALPSPSSPTPSSATRSSSPTSTCPHRSTAPRSSTGTATAPRSRTSFATPNTVPRYDTYPRDTRRSTRRGCGERCSRSASPAGYTSSPPPPDPTAH
jgi:hypothetical protein